MNKFVKALKVKFYSNWTCIIMLKSKYTNESTWVSAREHAHTHTHTPVSYTHLDVYKRQVETQSSMLTQNGNFILLTVQTDWYKEGVSGNATQLRAHDHIRDIFMIIEDNSGYHPSD